MGLNTEAADLLDELVALRRDLHQYPEIGLDLPRTQEKVLAALDGVGLEISTGEALSSVTAVLRGGKPGGVVLLRADMDALPIVERSGEEFASRTTGVMHACGHDLHTAGLVGAARLLTRHRADLAGDVVFMFQPGEEGHDGAAKMIHEGVLDAAGRPVDAAFALHVHASTQAAGTFVSRPGPMLAACDVVVVRVVGEGGHGSSPWQARDPLPAACEMVTALQTMVGRSFDPFDPVVITVGTFRAGTQANVIPDDVTFTATVRSFSPESRELVGPHITTLCEGIAAAHRLDVDVSFDQGYRYPATVNDESGYGLVRETVREVFGADRFQELRAPLPVSEDFSHVLGLVPGAFVVLGASCSDEPEQVPGNHSARARFDDGVLPDAAALLAELATRQLALPADGEVR
jgi:amidohydrolase